MKTCRKCMATKDLSDFHRDGTSKDGHSGVCKSCACARTAAWKANHQDRAKESGRRRYQSDKDGYKARAKRWAQLNRERRREIVRASDAKNRDRRLPKRRAERKARYHADIQASREESRRNAKKFRKTNPVRCRAIAAKARAKRRAQILGTRIGPVDFNRIMARDRMRCHICKKPVKLSDLHFDHVIPLSRGGEHSETNIAVSHGWCNVRKSATVTRLF